MAIDIGMSHGRFLPFLKLTFCTKMPLTSDANAMIDDPVTVTVEKPALERCATLVRKIAKKLFSRYASIPVRNAGIDNSHTAFFVLTSIIMIPFLIIKSITYINALIPRVKNII